MPPEEFATTVQLDGVGGRITNLQRDVDKHGERIGRNKDDIEKNDKTLWDSVEKIRCDVKENDDRIQGVELVLNSKIQEMETTVVRHVADMKAGFTAEVFNLKTDIQKTTNSLALKVAAISGGIAVIAFIVGPILQGFFKG